MSLTLFFHSVPNRVRECRLWVWLAFLVVLLVIAPGATRFQLDLSDEFFFPRDSQVRVAFDRFRSQFGGDESIYLVYRARDGDVFSHESLKAVRDMQEDLLDYRLDLAPGEASPLDRITEVTSLVNVSYLEASSDSLISRQFIGDKLPQNKAQRDAYYQAAMNHPDYPYMYVSQDGKYGGILIRTNFKARRINDEQVTAAISDGADLDFDVTIGAFDEAVAHEPDENREFEAVDWGEYLVVMQAVRKIIEKPEYTAALEYYPVGIPPMNAFIWEHFLPQINSLMVGSFVLIMVGLTLLFRSVAAVVWPIVIIGVASILAIGTLGWLGLKMNLMVNVTVLLVMVVGVADSVHVLSGYLFFRNKGQSHREALTSTYEKSGMALFLTSLTTGIGMLALLVVDVQPIQNFGISAALGVLFAFLMSVFILPLMLDIWHPVSKHRAKKISEKGHDPHMIQHFLHWVEPLSYKHPKVNVGVFVMLALVFSYGITKIEVDSNPISIFAEGNPIREAYELVDDQMGGTTNLEIMIEGGQENALQNPRLLMAMDRIQTYLLENLPDTVTVTRSLVNIVKESNQALNSGNHDFYTIPADENILRQTLFLFNSANPSDRRKVVSDDYSKAHITVNLVNQGSKYYVQTLDKIRPQVDKMVEELKNELPGLKITFTGSLTMFSTLLEFLSWSQIKGFGLALSLISIIVLFIFKSKLIGIIALFPNIFPLVFVFGMMGFMGIPLDVDTLIVAPLMIGIVVDDTIHFLTHYRAEVVKDGDIVRAIIVSIREVGQAITFTTIILSIAFLAFMLLNHQGLANFGFLSGMAIISALLADLFLLPALLLLTNARIVDKHPPQPAVATG